MITNRYFSCAAAALLLLGLACAPGPETDTPWQPLFNGTDLNGWEQLGGEARYAVEDGAIVGRTVHQTPNSFLATQARYGDFILELEYRVDTTMNSGIQIRSNSFPYYQNGRVHGYQVEIDPSARAWSAGIYDEGRRGWLVPLDGNPEAQQAFRRDGWNHYRIEAIGDTLKTWINQVPAAHLIDDKTGEGFIALQVHSIGKDQQAGTEIRWRNLRILTDSLQQYTQDMPLEPITTLNRLTAAEQDGGWQLLWDGATAKGWRGARLDSFPATGWNMENGILTVLASGGAEAAAGGDIVTEETFGDFEMHVDFRITEGANSGIKYYVDTELNQGEGSAIGLEYQILDDARHPDAKLGNHEGSRTLASLYDLIAAAPDKPVAPIGQWNTAYIRSENGHVEHWLNGARVLEYQRGSEAYRQLVAESKYKVWPAFGEAPRGHILLQDHGDRVQFRNIKIKPLNE
ncbi:DUF1080 domain-containing protein [Robiginitalea sp. M366]|uniref:3-keto-disaccharide hydrolase n=1 Tax=Robiginitalea aestuariiviva TaxID=3036903 RepID=UPI00240E036D|nr:DUF1080 domain-containing protein [Robiginitalea aestuariiviva]MDG1571083.1 DUF1080 domain-containing protein [Robiginitalea aestuariiviva]